jgi:hypothetical protein
MRYSVFAVPKLWGEADASTFEVASTSNVKAPIALAVGVAHSERLFLDATDKNKTTLAFGRIVSSESNVEGLQVRCPGG